MKVFTYDVDPVGKVRMTQSDKWKKRPCVVRYRMYADRLRELGCTLENGDAVFFYIPMPVSWPAKKRALRDGTRCESKPDLDNLLGALMDAVHPDGDSHLSEFAHVGKVWADTGKVVVLRSSTTAEASTPEER